MRKTVISILSGSLVFLIIGCPEKCGGATSAVDDYETLLEELPTEFDLIVPEQSIDAKTKYPDYVYVKSGKITSIAEIIPYEYVGENAIRIGWYPYDKPIKRKLKYDANFYAEPLISADVLAEIPKGTSLDISGKAVFGTKSISEEEWQRYFHDLVYRFELPLGAIKTKFYWRRVELNGQIGWVEGPRFEYSGDELDYGWCPAGFGPWGQGLTYDDEMNITEITGFKNYNSIEYQPQSDKWYRYYENCGFMHVTRDYIELISRNEYDRNAKSGFIGEICTPKAYDLYYKRDNNRTTPEWFSNLLKNVFVADYYENHNGVWVADAANARVIFFYANRDVSIELGDFVLPAALTGDGDGGVWVYDSELNRLTHLNNKVQPIEMIEGIDIFSLVYNPDTEILWICEKFRVQIDEYSKPSNRIIGFSKEGELISQYREMDEDPYLGTETKGVDMVALENGSLKVYRWLVEW